MIKIGFINNFEKCTFTPQFKLNQFSVLFIDKKECATHYFDGG